MPRWLPSRLPLERLVVLYVYAFGGLLFAALGGEGLDWWLAQVMHG